MILEKITNKFKRTYETRPIGEVIDLESKKYLMECALYSKNKINISPKTLDLLKEKKMTKPKPVRWTEDELSLITEAAKDKLSFKELQELLPTRTDTAIAMKIYLDFCECLDEIKGARQVLNVMRAKQQQTYLKNKSKKGGAPIKTYNIHELSFPKVDKDISVKASSTEWTVIEYEVVVNNITILANPSKEYCEGFIQALKSNPVYKNTSTDVKLVHAIKQVNIITQTNLN